MIRSSIVAIVVSIAATVGALAQSPGGQTPVARGAALSGVVVEGADRRPAAGALVMIAGTDVGLVRVTTSDTRGRFAFTGLPGGRFLLSAGKTSRLASQYGAARAGRPGAIVPLQPGQRIADITLTLVQGAAVSGRVLDQHGQPVADARVRMLPRRNVGGEVNFSGDAGDPANAATDDAGMYRIFDLPPGDYTLAIQPRRTINGAIHVLTREEVDAALTAGAQSPVPPIRGPAAPADGPAIGYAALYYGDTSDAAAAKVITLAEAEERTGIDVHTKLVPFVRVDGMLTSPQGPIPANVQVTLRPRGFDVGGAVQSINMRPSPDGRFTFNGIPPGEYTVLARTQPSPQAPARPGIDGPQDQRQVVRWAMRDITVSTDHVSNVALELRPALTMSGRVVAEGLPRLPAQIPALRVSVRPTLATGQANAFEQAPVSADGRFAIQGLVPGKYRLFLAIPGNPNIQVQEWFAKSAIVDGRDVLDVPFELKAEAPLGDALITLTEDTQEIDGRVLDASNRPAHDCSVVAFSTDRQFWFQQSRRIVFRQTNADGTFVFGMGAALPAGDYFVATTTDSRPNEQPQFDPAFLEDLVRSAEKVTLHDGDSKTITLHCKKN